MLQKGVLGAAGGQGGCRRGPRVPLQGAQSTTGASLPGGGTSLDQLQKARAWAALINSCA